MSELTCYDCGQAIDEDSREYILTIEGNYYCDSCSENLSYCDHCERYCEDTSAVIVRHGHREGDAEYWCSECRDNSAYQCDDCGDMIARDMDWGPSDRVVCPTCYEDHYCSCDDCGDTVHVRDTVLTPEGTYCTECAEDHEGSGIHDYRYTPKLVFHRANAIEDRTPLYLGFELEAGDLADGDDAADTARNISEGQEDWLYCKSDGSIPDYGFEMVSHPATLAAHKSYGWNSALGAMREAGMKSHDIDNCGLHVHVNRNYLTGYRWIIVDWLVSKNRRAFEKIARRKETQWAKYTKNEEGAPLKDVYAKCYYIHSYRYRAVNFENAKTVEFRLFKGTLKYETFMATLEIVDALVRWARAVHVHDILKSRDAFGEFKKYIENNPGRYENAVRYIKAKHI